jgi:hypothetical protein
VPEHSSGLTVVPPSIYLQHQKPFPNNSFFIRSAQSDMPEPITTALVLTVLGIAAAILDVCKKIAEWFTKIGDWRLANMFKKLGLLVQSYKRNGFLTSTGTLSSGLDSLIRLHDPLP